MTSPSIRRPADANWRCVPESFGGSSIVPAEAWAQLASSLRLSGRELQIVRGTFDDRTELEIADDLDISAKTVHTHVERLHHKLAVTGRTQLVLRVMQEFMAMTDATKRDRPPVCPYRGTISCPLPM